MRLLVRIVYEDKIATVLGFSDSPTLLHSFNNWIGKNGITAVEILGVTYVD